LASEDEIRQKIRLLLGMRGGVLDPSEEQPRRVIRVPQSQPTTMYAPSSLENFIKKARELNLILPPPFHPFGGELPKPIEEFFRALNQPQQHKEEPIKVVRCPKCGAELPEGLNFCPICGTRLKQQNEKRREPHWRESRVLL